MKTYQVHLDEAVEFLSSYSSKFTWVGVYLLRGDHLELGPYRGPATEHTRIPVGVGVCGTAVAEDRDQNIPDVRAIQNYLACSLTTRSELVVLIRDQNQRVIGQIDIDSNEPNAFGLEEEAVVRRVAKELGALWKE